MPTIERMTVTMPAGMAATVKEAVAGGDYASASEVVREALREWKAARATQRQELANLKADIERGLADLEAGRTSGFDRNAIIEQGRKLLGRARSESDR